jgi:hypothetical protein
LGIVILLFLFFNFSDFDWHYNYWDDHDSNRGWLDWFYWLFL